MNFHLIEDNIENNQFHLKVSENKIWEIWIHPVMYGFRIAVARVDGAGPEVDYCGGTDENTLSLIYTCVERILNQLPEDISYSELHQHFPEWTVRPVQKDENFMNLLKESAKIDSEIDTEELPSLAIIRFISLRKLELI